MIRTVRDAARASLAALAIAAAVWSCGSADPGGGPTTLPANAPASITKLSGDAQSYIAGLALVQPIVVAVYDASGNPFSGATVTFAVSQGSVSPATFTTAANGQATTTWTLGPSAGTQSLTASVTGVSTAANFSASATVSNVALASITQDTLTEGTTITLNGSGFTTVAANDTVKVDGVVANVTAATATQLTATVPAFDCRPARDGAVTVSVAASASNPVTKRIHPASFVNLAAGAQQIINAPASFCLQFRATTSGSEGYVFGVGAAAEVATAQFPLSISTSTGASSSLVPTRPTPAAAFVRTPDVSPARVAPTPLDTEISNRWQRQYQSEGRLRQWERDNFARMRPGALAASRAAASPRAQFLAPLPAVGDTIRVGVANFSNSNLCTGPTSVLAKVKAVGSAGIWATDVNNPGPDSLLDAEVKAYSDTFDLKIYAGDTLYFGAPSDLDGNSRVIIVMSIEVNKEQGGGIAGFVFSGDLVSKSSCAASNVGEYFYGNVPDPNNAAGTGARTHASVASQLPSLIAHEFSHDIQFSRRLVLGGGIGMSSWEAEGQAMMAQELVGHLVLGNTAGNNYNSTTMSGTQNRRWYKQGFDLLGAYFGSKYVTTAGKNDNAPEQCSLYAGTSTANIACFNFAFYGASWSFQRYLVDRFSGTYTGGVKQFTRDVIGKNVSLTGRSNWENLLGVTPAGYDSLYAQWGAMLYMDDRVASATAVQTMTSWNIFDILGNLSTNDVLVPVTRTFTSFVDSRTVNGGGTAYTTISSTGAHAATAVKVRAAGGATITPSAHPVLWISRVQ